MWKRAAATSHRVIAVAAASAAALLAGLPAAGPVLATFPGKNGRIA